MNLQKKLIILVLVTLSSIGLFAQKVRYKDLISLLTSKQYEKAEPFLKKYLKDNTDNPNAYLYMAIIFQDKTLRMDPLLHTEVMTANLDSAMFFYDKAYKTITEKELRRNDDYYEAYSRRDPRTGKFVIKLSDVQLFMDDQIKAGKEKKIKINYLKTYFIESEKAYGRALAIFKSLQGEYVTDKILYLRADERTVTTLKKLGHTFDSSVVAFERYKTVSKQLGKTGHDQILELVEIKDYNNEGSLSADFMKDNLKVWDYKRWTNDAVAKIEKEMIPLRHNLIAYDIELNKLHEKLKNDSTSVKNDLTKLINKLLEEQLKKYDNDPLPLAVSAMKTAELEYLSDLMIDKPVKDSANVKLRLNTIAKEIKGLKRLDSISSLLEKRNFDEENLNYKFYIHKVFGQIQVLNENIISMREFAEREIIKKQKQWEVNSQSLKWLTAANADSIPLFVESNRDLKYKPLVITEDKFTYGLVYQDSLAKGYFYKITPSRIAGYKVIFPVDQPVFKKKNFSLFRTLWVASSSEDTYFLLIYSTQKTDNQFKGSLIKLNRTDGLVWSNNFSFETLPTELLFNNDTAEISIKQTDADGAAKIMVVDKSGKKSG
ncbi:MAG: hypothetical protein JSS93_08650 [Bacteroidetes bacterium]|nr:hypothetical protein [Bacteroidota bacterium]